MINLTILEKDVLQVVLSSFIPNSQSVEELLATLKVKERVFSGIVGGNCSGFYTHLQSNHVLSLANEIPREYSVQAKYARLSAGEMGFYVFSDKFERGVKMIEGFFYGDDVCGVDELMSKDRLFAVYGTEGL